MKKIKGKLLAAAIALLGLSTAGAVTGTVAWFTAANTVKVSEMFIQAEAENGIVISNEGKAEWKTEVLASHNGKDADDNYYTFIPTSTKDSTAWYHGNATDANSYAGTSVAFTVTAPAEITGNGVGTINLNEHSEDVPAPAALTKNIYLLNHFYIQASAASPLNSQSLYVKEINAIRVTSTSTDLDKSLRVLFKLGSENAVIYAPLATGNTVAHDNTNSDGHGGYLPGTSAITTINKNASIDTTDVYDKLWTGNIPAYTAAGTNALNLSVYIYFEGEDFNCKSANIKDALDGLSLDFTLENK